MRVLFVTVYNPDNYGVKCLASQLMAHGHDIHVLQLKNNMSLSQQTPPQNEPLMLSYRNGAFNVIDLDRMPISSIEKALFAQVLTEKKPDVVAVSMFGVHQKIFPEVADVISQAMPRAFLLAGGVGPTLDPEFFLRNGAKAVMLGEGETAFPEFLDVLQKDGDWRKAKNMVYLENGELIANPLHPPVADLSSLPLPLNDPAFFSSIEEDTLFPTQMNLAEVKKNPGRVEGEASCLTSRGCLGSFAYCAAESLRKVYTDQSYLFPRLRKRSLAHIFKELHEFKKSGARHIYFYDDFFVRPHREMHEFLKRYAREINLPFTAYFHPVQLLDDPGLIDAAIAAGNETFIFGIQSGSRDLCENIYGRKFLTKDYAKLFSLIKERGGNIYIQLIGGNPLQTEAQFRETLEFCKLLPYDPAQKITTGIVHFYLAFYPGIALAKNFPGIDSMPRSIDNFRYQAALAEVRRLTDDSQFESIYNDPYYRERPGALVYLKQVLERDLKRDYLQRQLEQIKGKPVYFWGGGDIYRYKKHLFSETRPQRIIVDEGYDAPEAIDGIPTGRPNEVLTGENLLPIVIFARYARKIYHKIRKNWPDYKNIIFCNEI